MALRSTAALAVLLLGAAPVPPARDAVRDPADAQAVVAKFKEKDPGLLGRGGMATVFLARDLARP